MTRYVADAVVTCDAESNVYMPGVVCVDGRTITRVGPLEDGQERRAAPVLGSGQITSDRFTGTGSSHDARDEDGDDIVHLRGALLPGLVNTHCHSPMTLLRGAGGGLPLERWLAEAIWPREARLTGEDVYWGMTLACAEMLCNGVTTSCEMYFFSEEIADAVEGAGMRCMVTPGIILASGLEYLGTWQEQLDRVSEFHQRRHGSADGRIAAGFAAHAAYTLPLDAYCAVALRACEAGALFHTHLAETRSEAAYLEAEHGASVTRILADQGALDGEILAAHGVWLSREDRLTLARHAVTVAHCPQSNAKLGSGIARVRSLRNSGVRVSLGTDGPASNDNLDLWEEIRLAVLLAGVVPSLSAEDAAEAQVPGTELTPQAVLDMATMHGAAALRFPSIGTLAAGYEVDMLLVDTDSPAFTPMAGSDDLLNHLVWSGDSRSITDVWVAGQQVVKDGQCLTVDVGRARREVQLRAGRLAAD